jgi:hypothetical protein
LAGALFLPPLAGLPLPLLDFLAMVFVLAIFFAFFYDLKFKFQKSVFSCLYRSNLNSNGFKGDLNF